MSNIVVQRDSRIIRATLRQPGLPSDARSVISLGNPRTRVIATVQRGVRGAQGPSGNATPAFYFDYGDATPAILTTLAGDQVIKRAALVILTAFNGAGAAVSLGTTGSPALLMATNENDLSGVASYETAPEVTVADGTQLKAFITPGTGATTGRCMVLIEYAQA